MIKHLAVMRLTPILLIGSAFNAPLIQANNALTAAQIHQQVKRNTPHAITLYRELLGLPNDANYPNDIEKLSAWLTQAFRDRAFKVEKLKMSGSPIVYAERLVPGAKKTVLVYLQADGQPVDRSAWDQPNPYKAELKHLVNGQWKSQPWPDPVQALDPDWRIFARSAADSKGPIAQFLTALDILDNQQASPEYNLKIIMDTEEEQGSPNLPQAIKTHKDKLSADLLLIFDGPPHQTNKPTITMGARGIATIQLITYGPHKPQHSGHYGNYAPNPALHLAQILGSMKSQQGKVLIRGFYDGVSLSAQLKAQLATVPDDEAQIMKQLGFSQADAVASSLQESIQYPSLNIRGMSSAWVGKQARTIVPATATAAMDIRLVKESDASHLIKLVRQHIEKLGYYVIDRPPTDTERAQYPYIVSMTSREIYGAFRSEPDSAAGQMAIQGITKLLGESPIVLRSGGGSIPIAPIVDTLNIPAAIVASVNSDNNQHSPNENLRIGHFIEGIAIITSVLNEKL
ncbi:M20/M25/M40 family metallo-hydrolase [Pseudoalteromonas sp. OOF1S-7]|uniref:M20/M25/M40 family metallo-hydrolase n=1 Tax=Pseudoalteromonas sp. OOF1S-7 TaxID=2917757 RepID=UPI001EF4E998|nr:M20/M25/M40 family metallo-hydrolase [Pseudoalteromonas sp. OOF1S-7]MCG7534304.1 M20/M25/M40 family metallo-hydrolase [Pseudoalteromonas sp. OOF1S-7]